MSKVINLWGGPGAGKSTTAAGLFFEMKLAGLNVELVTEYAKSKVWEGAHAVLDDQIYVSSKQYHRQFVLKDKVDYMITDSPIILGVFYSDFSFVKFFTRELYNQFDNVNYMIDRNKAYNPIGRYQSEEEAKVIDLEISQHLHDEGIPYQNVLGGRSAPTDILFDLQNRFDAP